jgi:hypothetical protein
MLVGAIIGAVVGQLADLQAETINEEDLGASPVVLQGKRLKDLG